MIKFLMAIGTLAALAFSALPAHAQNTRSWVASNGLDGNPCTRAQPCATFTRAIAVTNARGEINCVDAGDFGSFIIDKSLTLDCTGVGGGGAVGTSVVINAGGVILRGLTLNGAGTSTHGIIIQGFGAASERVLLENLHIHGSTGRGVWVAPYTLNHNFTVVISNVQITDNVVGVYVDTSFNLLAKSARVTIKNSVISGNTANGLVVVTSAGNPARAVIEDSVIAANSNIGILVNGADAMAIVSNSTITTNNIGVTAVNGGQILSYGNNRMHANVTANGAFTGALPLQ